MKLCYRTLNLFFAAALAATVAPLTITRAQSPFMPNAATTTVAPTDNTTHELVGIITSGANTLVGLTDRNTRKSVWIQVGKSVDGVEVVSCDAKNDRVTVRIGGELKTLAMRQTAPTGSAAAISRPSPALSPVPTPLAPVVAASPANPKQAEEEREARMLVSDLLEIGMQQRKAYEEAQRKAQQQKAPAPAANPKS